MEESEKRKERLKAMRLEAAQADANSSSGTTTAPVSLSNPLIESSVALSGDNDHRTTPRFDFYTDPMAAFSANKKNKPSPSFPGVKSPEMNAFPVHQMPGNYLPRPYQGLGMADPFPMQQGPPDPWNGSRPPANFHNAVPGVIPRAMVSTPPMPRGSSPRAWGWRGGNSPSPGFTPAGGPNFNYGRGRPPWLGNNSAPNSGRVRGRGYGNSSGPGFGRGSRQGHGFHGRSFASNSTLDPECLFHESMLEDPWQDLKPALWRKQEVTISSSSYSSSVNMTKGRVSEASNKSNSQPSLAEYLAASFNKAGDNAPS